MDRYDQIRKSEDSILRVSQRCNNIRKKFVQKKQHNISTDTLVKSPLRKSQELYELDKSHSHSRNILSRGSFRYVLIQSVNRKNEINVLLPLILFFLSSIAMKTITETMDFGGAQSIDISKFPLANSSIPPSPSSKVNQSYHTQDKKQILETPSFALSAQASHLNNNFNSSFDMEAMKREEDLHNRQAHVIYGSTFSGLQSYGYSGMSILEELIDLALQTCENSRPSGGRVDHHSRGAALLGPTGKVYLGCDVHIKASSDSDNGVSAERAALLAGVADGAKKFEVCF
jgi:hypothetical protein